MNRPRPRPIASTVSTLAGLALVAALALGCGSAEPATGSLPAGSNVLLITVDTLRADHLSSYGYPRATSPVLDRLATEGVRFDQAAVQWPKTGPSMASMFTATYPKDNGIVRRIGDPVPCRFRMLAEILKDAGYSTHAVVANGALASEFHFDQGFDTYIETWKLPADDSGGDPNGAAQVTRLASAVAERGIERGKPYFLWVHYLDPHAPYAPPEPWSDRFQGDEHFDPAEKIELHLDKKKQDMMGIGASQVLDGRDELAFYVARYDAEIAYNDRQIGLLLERLGELGLLEDTLTVVTSDHGESLGEHHYYFDHGRFGFQTCLRVPLLFHYPGVLEPRVDRQPVELIHLAPTLLEMAGEKLDRGRFMQGQSLAPRLFGTARGEGGLAYSEAGWETKNKWQKIVRDHRFKLIYAQTTPEQRWIGGEGVRFTLFDLAHDPAETNNVAEAFPEELERLKRELWRWDNAGPFPVEIEPASAACADEAGNGAMDAETRELLESLGYL